MALIGNHSVLTKTPGRSFGGVGHATARSESSKSGAVRGRFTGWASHSLLASTPDGNQHPAAWIIAIKPGGMSSRTIIVGVGSTTLPLVGGKNASATIAGSSAITTAVGQLVASAVATLNGTGSISAADARAFLNAAATLTASGSLAGDASALAIAAANLPGVGAVTPTVSARGHMDAEVSPFSTLSPESLAEAVWGALANDYQDPDTLGGQARFLYLLAHNKVVTDPVAGSFTVYDDDGTTVLFTADLWQDAAGTTPYAGSGSERRDTFA